ncbi:MAG: hypothetical protein IJ794_11260 [Lachnospiraceae bacterium]|nr:hypothetical protein [Lachnospiraceae bacterium]
MTFLREKIGRWCCIFMAVIGIGVYTFLTIYACRYSKLYSSEYAVTDCKDNLVMMLFGIVGAVLVTWFLNRQKGKLVNSGIRVIAVVLSLLFGLFAYRLVSNANEWVVADTAQVYLAAKDMAEGVYDGIILTDYFRVYPYQLYVATIFSLLFQIARSVEVLAVFRIQAVLAGMTVYGVYMLSHEIWNDATQDILSILAAVSFLPIALYSLSFYGECIATFCCVYALFFFNRLIKERILWKKIVYSVALLLLILVTYFSRGALLIVVIAMCIIGLLEVFGEKKMFPMIVMACSLILIAAACAGVNRNVSRRSGVAPDSGTPMLLGVVMALQDGEGDNSVPGVYTGYERELYVASGFDREKAQAQALEDLKGIVAEWTASPRKILNLMKRKQLAQYNEPTYGAFAATWYMEEPQEWISEIYHGTLKKPIWDMLNILQTLLYLGATAYFVDILLRPRRVEEGLIGFVLVGEFLFSMIWETQSRYIYPYMVMLLPCSARGIYVLSDWLLQTITRIWDKQKGAGREK